ncbi:NADH-quinone oxidoreductase subunit N, partial [Photobacterium sp. OFAV2-7]|uniref:NADH-quinone oxidoreductase subunit N n=1 Tax=Photobacterium sp. OFAV2-7 TaxID=2917748 RepID=UPI001EF720DD
EAALKYVILGALSSAILLYGISLFYGLTGTTQLQHIATALSGTGSTAGAKLDNTGLILATVFLLAGFGFKVAAVPFHMWQPDVYQGAPTPITAFLSVGPKIAGIVVIMRVFMVSFAEQQIIWGQLLTAIAIATMVTGSLVALVQSKIKRLLAYSSISHVGFILLAFLTSAADGFYAIAFYLSAYAFMNLGAFAVIIALYSGNQDNEDIDDYCGLVHHRPWLATIMALFLFSLAGIPPTAGFIAKFNIIMALIGHQHTVLAILAVIFSVVSAYYYIRIVLVMFMKPAQHKFSPAYSVPLVIVLATTATITLGLGVYPAPLIDIIHQLSP